MAPNDEHSVNAGHSALDEAYRLASEGERSSAARHATAILAADPSEIGAATLLLEALPSTSADLAPRVAARIVDASIRRGDLPGAVAGALASKQAELPKLIDAIATAFSSESDRLAPHPPAPPPIPRELSLSEELLKVEEGALPERVQDALAQWLEWEDPIAPEGSVPKLPLFSAMRKSSLKRLLLRLTIRDVAAGESVIEQGTEGTEAFVVVRGMLLAQRRRAEGVDRLAAFGPGAIFGEMALVSDAPRAAFVEAVEGSRLIAMSRESLEREAARDDAIGRELGSFCRARMVANLVRHSPILAAVDPGARTELIDRFETVSFETGDELLKAGEESPGLFLIASGQVAVEGTDSDGERIRLADLGPGDVVGEISLVLRRPATASVRAAHHTVALLLSREGFQQAIKEHPGLLAELYEVATARDDETQSVVGQQALDIDDVCLL